MADEIENLTDMSRELKRRIKHCRKQHSVLVFILLGLIASMIWLFQASGISFSYIYKIGFTIFVLPIGYLTFSYVNSAFKVICPKCTAVVEQSRLPGDQIPLACPKCKLSVAKD